MFKDHPIKSYVVYSLAAAMAYSLAAYFFIRSETFRSSWILFIGNMLFAGCIACFILLYNRKRKENANTGTMIFAGHITTVMGIIIACVICLILFFLMSDVSHPAQQAGDVLNNAPPAMHAGKRNEFLFALFMNAVVGNISAGSFISILLPYAAKRDQREVRQ